GGRTTPVIPAEAGIPARFRTGGFVRCTPAGAEVPAFAGTTNGGKRAGLPRRRAPRNDEVRIMLLHIVARGKIGRGPEAELVERYLKRLSWPVKVTELPESGGRVPPAPE